MAVVFGELNHAGLLYDSPENNLKTILKFLKCILHLCIHLF